MKRFSIRILITSALCISLSAIARGQAEGAIVTRHGASIHGTVEGKVVALDDAAIVIVGRDASIVGDLVLPAEKSNNGGGNNSKSPNDKAKVSAQATVTVDDASTIKGTQKPARGFDLPKVAKPQTPKGSDKVVLQNDKDKDPDFAKLKDLTVKAAKRDVKLPPGAYGDLSVQNGRVLLGQAGSLQPSRYYFQSISAGANGQIDLLGPSIVVVDHLGSIQGLLGNAKYANWLDLRVAGGDAVFDVNSEIHGVVSAPNSAATISRGSKIRGGLFCDKATSEPTSKFTGVAPSWSKESSGNSLPVFVYKATRVASRVPDLMERYGSHYTVVVEYPSDEPFITLGRKPTAVERSESNDQRSIFFDACCVVFDGTNFPRGHVVLAIPPTVKSVAPKMLDVVMERSDFENHLWSITHEPDLRASIRMIRDSSLLLNVFMERAQKVARDSARGGAR